MSVAPSAPDFIKEEAVRRLSRAENVIFVGAGKGGVGKSLISALLALALADEGKKVGLLDVDVHGSSLPHMLGASGPVVAGREGIEPTVAGGVHLMSVGLLVGDSPLPAVGEIERSLVVTMMALTNWPSLDYLVIDLPPGTGDEVISALRVARNMDEGSFGTLVVATPSLVARRIVRRVLSLLRDERVRVLGLVENMSYVPCPGGGMVRPFGRGGVDELAEEFGVPVLARFPMDPRVEEAMEAGDPIHRCSEEISRAVEDLVRGVEGRMGG